MRSTGNVPTLRAMPTTADRPPVARTAGFITLLVLEALVAVQGVLAYRAHFFLPSQMQAAGYPQGLPFLWHFGMWGDVLIISPLIAYLVGQHAHAFRLRRAVLSLGIGIAAAGVLGWLFTRSSTPEAHVLHHRLTSAGVVHLVYLAIAVAALLNFVFFDPQATGGQLALSSLLVLIHVFAGTHMVLGLYALSRRPDWYPDQPLQNVTGWLMIGALALGLVWLNLRKGLATYGGWPGVARVIGRAYMYWVVGEAPDIDVTTPLGQLAFLDSLGAQIIEFGVFAGAAVTWWVQRGPLPSVLVLVFGVVYFLSRRSVKQELAIAPTLFPEGKVPQRWSAKNARSVTFTVIGYFLLYVSLAFLAFDIRIAAFVMLCIATIDLRTRRMIGRQMRGYLSDPRFAPTPGDHNADFVARRREVAEKFLFGHSDLRREVVRVCGCALALTLALAAWYFSVDIAGLAYVVLVVTLLANEWVLLGWRNERDQSLSAIDAEVKARAAAAG
jgi:hypothetical protein